MAKRTYKMGADRGQLALLPLRPDDYVSRDNPVRAIEAYVDSLDLERLGFRHAGLRPEAKSNAGQPPYDPRDHLKLYLYGYMSGVRSSRRLAREAERNLEVIWLLGGLRPGYRAIGDFRKTNAGALRAAHQDFVILLRAAGLMGGEVIAVDGSFFRGDASKASIKTRAALQKDLARIEASIAAYAADLEENDKAEDEAARGRSGGGEDAGASPEEKLKALIEKRREREADLAALEASGESQLSKTDPDARLLRKSGQVVAGYNVQIAVDVAHKLIVADKVTNEGNDAGQLAAMAAAAKAALEVETLTAVADAGYWDGAGIKACEDAGVTPYVPERAGEAAADRFPLEAFVYDPHADHYRCPAGEVLAPKGKPTVNESGKTVQRYAAALGACRTCPLRAQCLPPKSERRELRRWEHAAVVDRHRVRMMTPAAAAMAKARSGAVEHPWGTLKCRAGWRHFLVRGLRRVEGEWSLMALAYNFSRALNILGLEGLEKLLAKLARALLTALASPLPRPAVSRPA